MGDNSVVGNNSFNIEKDSNLAPPTTIANINTGNNSVVGNNTNSTITINPSESFSDKEKKDIIYTINKKYTSVGQKGNKCVLIEPNRIHPKSHELVDDLSNYLAKKGYNVQPNSNRRENPGETQKIRYTVSSESCMRITLTYLNN